MTLTIYNSKILHILRIHFVLLSINILSRFSFFGIRLKHSTLWKDHIFYQPRWALNFSSVDFQRRNCQVEGEMHTWICQWNPITSIINFKKVEEIVCASFKFTITQLLSKVLNDLSSGLVHVNFLFPYSLKKILF